MRARRSPPPLWFSVCAAVVLGLVARAVLRQLDGLLPTHGRAPDVQLAFWQFILAAIGWAWNAFQAAGQVTLEVLAWAVKVLQSGAATMANAIKDGANALRLGFVKVWDWFRDVYNDVLKPAWQKFWTWFERLRTWLNKTFGPTLRWLLKLRAQLLKFWKTYVRPWLDLIDVTRKLLRVLSSLGLTWARALDKRLGEIEEAIEAPFRFVLGKLNEIINAVNTVMTLDGLLQRVALVRSLARDYKYAWMAIVQPYSAPVTQSTRGALQDGGAVPTLDEIEDDYRRYLRDGSGELAASVQPAVAAFRARHAG